MLLPLCWGEGKGEDDDGGGGGQNGRRSESKASRDRSLCCDALLSLGELSCEGDGGVGDGHQSMRLIVYSERRFLIRKYQRQQQLLTD